MQNNYYLKASRYDTQDTKYVVGYFFSGDYS